MPRSLSCSSLCPSPPTVTAVAAATAAAKAEPRDTAWPATTETWTRVRSGPARCEWDHHAEGNPVFCFMFCQREYFPTCFHPLCSAETESLIDLFHKKIPQQILFGTKIDVYQSVALTRMCTSTHSCIQKQPFPGMHLCIHTVHTYSTGGHVLTEGLA